MEILSVGDKIRRVRICNNMTLRDICNDKISISKMSCIENNKIYPEKWILEYVSDKLNVNMDYLTCSIRTQIENNIVLLKNTIMSEYLEKVKYNLKYAKKYKYYDLCFVLVHMIVDYCTHIGKLSIVKKYISMYYKCLSNCYSRKNIVTYYMDVALFLIENKEYLQAISYYESVMKILKKNNTRYTMNVMYYKVYCLIRIGEYDQAYGLMNEIFNYINLINDSLKKGVIYSIKAFLSLIYNKDDFLKYKKIAGSLLEKNNQYKIASMFGYAFIMFKLNMKVTAVEYVYSALKIYSCENNTILDKVYIAFDVIEELLKNDFLDMADEICSNILNESIMLNNVHLIEKSYYYKAIILERKGNIKDAEICIDISLDLLSKFSRDSRICKRYVAIGNMYYKNGNLTEAVKYFEYAFHLKK